MRKREYQTNFAVAKVFRYITAGRINAQRIAAKSFQNRIPNLALIHLPGCRKKEGVAAAWAATPKVTSQ
jgi:hypothetical protein